jgi:hypothetical protein
MHGLIRFHNITEGIVPEEKTCHNSDRFGLCNENLWGNSARCHLMPVFFGEVSSAHYTGRH